MVTTHEKPKKSEKATTKKGDKPKRTNRTPEQIVADLKAKIADVEARAAAKEAKATPETKALFAAAKAINKAHCVAIEAKAEMIAGALEAARGPLAAVLVEMGLRMPDTRKRSRGRTAAA
jgi:hypothetical protein